MVKTMRTESNKEKVIRENLNLNTFISFSPEKKIEGLKKEEEGIKKPSSLDIKRLKEEILKEEGIPR